MKKVIARAQSSSGKGTYVISLNGESLECSCPGWTKRFPRIDCRHIKDCRIAKLGGSTSGISWTKDGEAWVGSTKAEPVRPTKKEPKPAKLAKSETCVNRFRFLDLDD